MTNKHMTDAARLVIVFLGGILTIIIIAWVVYCFCGKIFPDKLGDTVPVIVAGLLGLLGRTHADTDTSTPDEVKPVQP